MKKILVLLTIFVSGTAFAQRGMGMYGSHHDTGRGRSDTMDNRGHHHSGEGMGHHRGGYQMSMIENMPEAQQEQLFALKEKFLMDMQDVKQKYEKDELALKLELQKIGVSFDKRDRGDRRAGRTEKEFSLEQAKAMLQAQEIKMQLHDLHRKARSEVDALKMKMEQDCNKIYQAWVNTL